MLFFSLTFSLSWLSFSNIISELVILNSFLIYSHQISISIQAVIDSIGQFQYLIFCPIVDNQITKLNDMILKLIDTKPEFIIIK